MKLTFCTNDGSARAELDIEVSHPEDLQELVDKQKELLADFWDEPVTQIFALRID
jgi:hypothetical protein